MDPLSVAGVVLGGTSLGIQMLKGCIAGYKLLSDVVNMPQHFHDRQASLRLQCSLLEAWGRSVGLLEKEDSSFDPNLGTDQIVIIAVLSEIRTLLDRFIEVNSSHEHLRPTDKERKGEAEEAKTRGSYQAIIQDNPSFHDTAPHKPKAERLKSWFKHTSHGIWDLLCHPRNLKWTFIDEKLFDDMLARLHELVDYLEKSLHGYQAKYLHDQMRLTYMELVQTRTTISELQLLLNSVNISLDLGVNKEQAPRLSLESNEIRILGELVELKTLVLNASEISLARLDGLKEKYQVKAERVTYSPNHKLLPRVSGKFTTDGQLAAERNVWIEWKIYDETVKENTIPPQYEPKLATYSRMAELTAMLALSKTADFCIPECIGFFNDNEPRNGHQSRSRFGWIFELPVDCQPDTVPTNLYEMLLNHQSFKPSLTARIVLARKLATSLLYLHAVGWVHKEFRSENVLLFEKDKKKDLTNPKITGFNFARPSSGDTTGKPQPDPAHDLYRWPTAQGASAATQSGRKLFDIYGLGLMLLEIVSWKPLYQILNFDLKTLSNTETVKVRNMLREDGKYLAEVLQGVGERFHETVKACLEGGKAFDIQATDNIEDPKISLKLQRMYREKVVKPLSSIDI